MNEAARLQRNRDRLQQLHPAFAARVAAVIDELEAEGWRPRIQDAWRSVAAQEAAFAAGHSQLKFGFHNVTGDDGRPEALAVDMLDDDSPLNPGKAYLLRLAAAAQSAGLGSGIRWGLSKKLAQAIDLAIADREWHAPVKIGWDPTHLEPLGLTVAQARAGARPTGGPQTAAPQSEAPLQPPRRSPGGIARPARGTRPPARRGSR